jgi:hypothetical protein
VFGQNGVQGLEWPPNFRTSNSTTRQVLDSVEDTTNTPRYRATLSVVPLIYKWVGKMVEMEGFEGGSRARGQGERPSGLRTQAYPTPTSAPSHSHSHPVPRFPYIPPKPNGYSTFFLLIIHPLISLTAKKS